jgi:hypothetical protein
MSQYGIKGIYYTGYAGEIYYKKIDYLINHINDITLCSGDRFSAFIKSGTKTALL